MPFDSAGFNWGGNAPSGRWRGWLAGLGRGLLDVTLMFIVLLLALGVATLVACAVDGFPSLPAQPPGSTVPVGHPGSALAQVLDSAVFVSLMGSCIWWRKRRCLADL